MIDFFVILAIIIIGIVLAMTPVWVILWDVRKWNDDKKESS